MKKKNYNFYIFMIIFFLSAVNITSQISDGAIPESFLRNNLNEIPTITMPNIDSEKLINEDEIDSKLGIPFRFGKEQTTNIDMNNSGKWTTFEDGSKIWQLRIVCPNAFSTNLLYDWFWLPEGARFFLYNYDKSEIIGAFTNENNKKNGEFATGLIGGEEVTLEYYEPVNTVKKGIISISKVIHGYKDIFRKLKIKDFGDSGSCNNNVVCEVGNDWRNEIRSVAMIIVDGGTRLCTGTLVNNTNVDFEQLFLTADHCLTPNVDSWIFMFNYESPICTANIDGQTLMTVQGANLLANNESSDFALVKIIEEIPIDYNVHWAGWSAIDNPSQSSVCIHHPEGDVKKISLDYEPVISSDYDPAPYLANSHWEVISWNDGTTESGSSGSPLFNQDYKIVGQLHGGYASCSSITQDYFGKFSMSWDSGTNPATRLKDWLDPGNTGILELDGFDPSLGNQDLIPPTAISDLSVIDRTSNGLTLLFSAPFDTSYGGVKSYDLRFSKTEIITENDFLNAEEIIVSKKPALFGELETIVIGALEPATDYYFAIKSSDRWSNISAISNIVLSSTLAAPKIFITPEKIELSLKVGEEIKDTIRITNQSIDPSTLEYSVSLENNSFPVNSINLKLISESSREKQNQNDKIKSNLQFGQSQKKAGGPDLFGYKWMDSDEISGPVFEWNDISTSGNEATNWISTGTYDAKDEGYSGPFSLGFDFNFYGVKYNSIFISSNGFLSFNLIDTDNFSNDVIPSSEKPNNFIAAFWEDLTGSAQGKVFYKSYSDKFVIQFSNWAIYNSNSSLTFQIVLRNNGKIFIYYKEMSGELNSSTVGIENLDGTDGLQVTNNASYIKNNLALQFTIDPEWMKLDHFEGLLFNQESAILILDFITHDLSIGLYSMDVVVSSNDPNNSTIILPITMNLTSGQVPVELTSFTAERNEKSIAISWATATETNNMGFEIERKINYDWENISFISGKGTTSEISKYYFKDDISSTFSNKISYRLKQIDYDGTYIFSDEIEIDLTPRRYILHQNFPNPFNPETKIKFEIPNKSIIQISVFNTLGQKLAVFENGIKEAGYYEINWNATNLASGLYLCVMTGKSLESNNEFRDVKKMLLIK